jgi:hypothetical protein
MSRESAFQPIKDNMSRKIIHRLIQNAHSTDYFSFPPDYFSGATTRSSTEYFSFLSIPPRSPGSTARSKICTHQIIFQSFPFPRLDGRDFNRVFFIPNFHSFPFPRLDSKEAGALEGNAKIGLSVVIPAYNEVVRMENFFFFKKKLPKFSSTAQDSQTGKSID